ncbi:MAG TPA: DUF2017 domain-containing protein [Trebonia sp.]|nr:DUF2017 domain-containing protein [Trebonia sp.]
MSVSLSAGEAQLLRTLIMPMMDLLTEDRGHGGRDDPAGAQPAAGPQAAGGRQDDVFDQLERMFDANAGAPAPETPEDPVLARLLPDAYREDPKAAGEFRKYTESSLREAKKYFAQTILDTLPAAGGRVKLTADQARDWMRALNDVRLTFGVRLQVTEDFEGQLAALDPEDPKFAAFEVYGWLGAVQESLVQALGR